MKAINALILAIFIAMLLCPYLVFAQIPVTIYGYVYMPDGSPAAGAVVTVKVDGKSKTTTTDSNGKYMVTFSVDKVPVDVVVTASKGSYTGSASRSNVEGAVRIDVHLKAPPPAKKSTWLSLTLIGDDVVEPNSSITVKGQIKPAMSVTITIVILKPSGVKITDNIKTLSDGSFTYTFSVDELGLYKVYARFGGNEKYYGSTSNIVGFTVKAKPSISFDVTYVEGAGLVINGSLGLSMEDIPLKLLISFDNKTWFEYCNVTSECLGNYSIIMNASIYGVLYIKIVTPETDVTQRSESNTSIVELKSPVEESLRNEISNMQQVIEELEDELEGYASNITLLENKLSNAMENITLLRSELESANAEASFYKQLSFALAFIAVAGTVTSWFVGRRSARRKLSSQGA